MEDQEERPQRGLSEAEEEEGKDLSSAKTIKDWTLASARVVHLDVHDFLVCGSPGQLGDDGADQFAQLGSFPSR